MTDTKTNLTITREDDGRISIQGDEATVKKAIVIIGEFFLKEHEMTEERLDTLVDIAEELLHYERRDLRNLPESEYVEAAKKFLEAAERYSHPRATNCLATLQKNRLISDAMDFRAAARGDGPCIDLIQESYEMQAELWQKKIAAKKAEVEGKPFEDKIPSKEEILNADRTSFFEIYERAFAGDLEAMETWYEFCKKEAAYWSSRQAVN